LIRGIAAWHTPAFDPKFATSWLFLLLAVAGLILYFLPYILAACLRRPNALQLLLFNLLLGWTVVDWIGVLVWARMSPAKPQGSAAEIARRRYVAREINTEDFERAEKRLS